MKEEKEKSILLSVKPTQVLQILSGKKIYDIRNTKPSCELPINVYVYCTKVIKTAKYNGQPIEGRVVLTFTLDKIEVIDKDSLTTETVDYANMIGRACLSEYKIRKYLDNKVGYLWHIKNVKLLNPFEDLEDFRVNGKPIIKSPQRWHYVTEAE